MQSTIADAVWPAFILRLQRANEERHNRVKRELRQIAADKEGNHRHENTNDSDRDHIDRFHGQSQ
jgi:hypothetical protein